MIIASILKLLPALKSKVNSSKTQCMFVTNQRTRLPETITIDGIRIEIKDSVKVLGVTLDNKLRFSSFVNSTGAKSYYHLRRITSIRKYLSFDPTKLLILFFVISKLDYCNSLLYGAPDYMIKKLQRIQKRAACLIFHQRNSNVNLLLNELHWLPVEKLKKELSTKSYASYTVFIMTCLCLFTCRGGERLDRMNLRGYAICH